MSFRRSSPARIRSAENAKKVTFIPPGFPTDYARLPQVLVGALCAEPQMISGTFYRRLFVFFDTRIETCPRWGSPPARSAPGLNLMLYFRE